MLQIIDSSFFTGELHIAQLAQRAVQQRIDMFIEKYTVVYLKEMLGYELYKGLKDAMGNLPLTTKWDELLNGGDYTDKNGNTKHWDGLKNDELISPIANYVYYWYSRDNAVKSTAGGDKSESVQGMVNIGPAGKQARAWNEMVDMNWKLHDFLSCKKVDDELVYDEYIGYRCRDMFNKINEYNL